MNTDFFCIPLVWYLWLAKIRRAGSIAQPQTELYESATNLQATVLLFFRPGQPCSRSCRAFAPRPRRIAIPLRRCDVAGFFSDSAVGSAARLEQGVQERHERTGKHRRVPLQHGGLRPARGFAALQKTRALGDSPADGCDLQVVRLFSGVEETFGR